MSEIQRGTLWVYGQHSAIAYDELHVNIAYIISLTLSKDLQYVDSKEDFKSRWMLKKGGFHSRDNFK